MLNSLIKKTATAYAVFVLLWFTANQLFQDSWWGIVILDKFAEYFLVAAVPIFLLSLLSRHTITVLLAVLPVAIAGYFYAPLISNFSKHTIIDRSERLRVTTYNIWNHNKELYAVDNIIKSIDSDVIALQEITEDQRLVVMNYLNSRYPYSHISKPILGGTTALFSRYSLENIIELDFGIDRPAIVADMQWQGVRVTVVSAHLNPSFWAYYQQPWYRIPGNYHQYIKDQNQQAAMIIEEVKTRTESAAVFLACDCNSQETASTNKLLRSYFKETFRSLGLQLGSPTNEALEFERKLNHIDYVWFAGSVEPAALYRAKESAGSDHQPVIADFYLSAE